MMNFGEVAVEKSLCHRLTIPRLPRYVLEYLVLRFSAVRKPDESISSEDLMSYVHAYYPEPEQRDRVLYQIKRKSNFPVLDEFKTLIDLHEERNLIQIPTLGVKAIIPPSILDENPGLFFGMWGLAEVQYIPQKNVSTNLRMTSFKPLSLRNVSLVGFTKRRRNFQLHEWKNLVIRTMGLDPEAYSEEQKILLLSRLIPLVQPNCNLMELSGKGVGKTYFFHNISSRSRVISGMISPATLFWDLNRDIPGEICYHDCLAFDELRAIYFAAAQKIFAKLKDYMSSGFWERGHKTASSSCSLVFLSNIEVTNEQPSEELCQALPLLMRNSAFVDRLHGVIPGWRLPAIKRSDEFLAKEGQLGLASHYFQEVLRQMRRITFQARIDRLVRLTGDLTIRDERAIKKLAEGMLKIVSPDGNFSSEELGLAVENAVNLRQIVANWLHRLSPGEFQNKKLGFEISRGPFDGVSSSFQITKTTS